MNKRWLWITLTMIICLGFSAGVYAAEDDQPKYKAYLGVTPKDGPSGVVLAAVAARSPAADAGLAVGDVILAVSGQNVNSARELSETIIPTLVPYTPATIVYQRSGARAETTIVPTGFFRLTVKDLPPRKFVIPGVPDNPPGPKSAVEALDQINVLKQVIIDPKTGSVEVIGTYDESYATGPIPYLDLLKTALQYPYPAFSLESTQESLANRGGKTYSTPQQLGTSAQLLLLGHPELEWERQQLINANARGFGVSREDYVAMYNFFTFDNRTGDVPPAIARIHEKAVRNRGYDEVADAYAVAAAGTPAAAEQALRMLGKSGGEYPGSPMVQAYFAMQEKLSNKPVQWALDKREDLNKANQTALLIRLQRGLLPEWDKARQKNVHLDIMEKMVLSDLATRILINNFKPYEAELIAISVDPTSQLYRIMYEADYALKRTRTYPELLDGIPGAMNVFEYMAKTGSSDRLEKYNNGARFWLEPRRVEMGVSPDRTVINFGLAEIREKAEFYDPVTKQDTKFPDDPDPDVTWDGWCAQFNDNYDVYARVIPGFHKLREAAKVIALARWIIAEHVAVNLAGVEQEKWMGPKTVPGFHYSGFTIQRTPDGGGILRAWGKVTGGVNFKSKHNWTTYTPAPQSETKVTSQLALSAGLGKKAVQAAQGGNLEQAKYLAELSAQAMNGSLSKLDLAKQNIVVPDVKPIPAAAANVQLQKEMVKKTYQQITASSQNSPAGKSSATLAQLSNLYDQVANNPASASDYLLKLQTGKLGDLPPAAQTGTAPGTLIQQKMTVCGESSLGAETLPAERKAYLTKKLAEARERLKYSNEALRKLIAINAAERAEIDKLVAQITEDYEVAKERAYDFVVATLIDLPLARYADIHDTKVKQLDDTVKGLIARSLTPMSAAEREALSREIQLVQSLKANYVDSYTSTGRLLDIYAGANYGRDIYKWDQDTRNSDFRKRAADGALLAGKIFLDHPKLAEYLQKKEWFGNNKLWQVVTMGKMAAYASDFFWDVMNLYAAWGPLAATLQSDLQNNTQAMEQLRLKAAQTSQEIDCLERLLR